MIDYRILTTPDQVAKLSDLWQLIWNTSDRDTLTAHVAIALHHAGGLALGAFDGDAIIGFALGFPGFIDGKLLHWSHAAGVLPAYQGRGVGTQIKWMQRQLVLEQEIDCIGWTYDPLQRGNAKFNLHRLGSMCNLYHVNLYGEMHDALNAGLPSDRFEVRWWLSSDSVCQREEAMPKMIDLTGIHHTLSMQADGKPGPVHLPQKEITHTLVEIPYSINKLRTSNLEVAVLWRLRTRQAFTSLFAAGFSAVDFVSEPGAIEANHHWYVLERRSR